LYGTVIACIYGAMENKMTKTKSTIIDGENSMRGILKTAGIPRKKMVACLVAVLFTCLWATASFASWSQGFNENGIYNGTTYNITKIEVFKLDGTSGLESPGMSNFTAGTWTVQMPNTNYAVATNATPGISNFNWLFTFTGTSSSSISLAYLAYTSTGQVFGTNLNFSGTSGWSYPEIPNVDVNNPVYNRAPSSVPIPPAALLFGTSLLSLVGLRKKLKA